MGCNSFYTGLHTAVTNRSYRARASCHINAYRPVETSDPAICAVVVGQIRFKWVIKSDPVYMLIELANGKLCWAEQSGLRLIDSETPWL